MSCKFFAAVHREIEPSLVEVEVSMRNQLPTFQIIGLASKEILESKERILSAMNASGFEIPRSKTVVNLAPADLPKNGSALDLAIAVGLLEKSGQLDKQIFSNIPKILLSGELGLNGSIKESGKILRTLSLCKEHQISHLILPKNEYPALLQKKSYIQEILLNWSVSVFFIENLSELKLPQNDQVNILRWENIQHYSKQHYSKENLSSNKNSAHFFPLPPLQELLLKLSLAGGLSIFLGGQKGVGKTQFIRWYSKLSEQILKRSTESLLRYELTEKPNSVFLPSVVVNAGPHSKPSVLIGQYSQNICKPGLLHLAHEGVFVADEFPEWHRDAREVLREPLESKTLTVSRTHFHQTSPCQFIFISTGNLCPCGEALSFNLDIQSQCVCNFATRKRYLEKISGPILDRIELQCILSQEAFNKTIDTPVELQANTLLKEIKRTREKLLDQYKTLPAHFTAETLSSLGLQVKEKFNNSLEKYNPRSKNQIIKTAITHAALRGESSPERIDIELAKSLRIL